tara:strand:+ start:322 stop:600 length:279 start_codon:yes stop_codon:yes gene_type:complete
MSKQTEDLTTKGWEKTISKCLVGRKIVEVRYLTEKEADHMGWRNHSIIMYLDDGNYLVPMQDDEGNDGGAVLTSFNKELPTIPVIHSRYYND